MGTVLHYLPSLLDNAVRTTELCPWCLRADGVDVRRMTEFTISESLRCRGLLLLHEDVAILMRYVYNAFVFESAGHLENGLPAQCEIFI